MNQREFTRVRTTIPIDCAVPGGRTMIGTTRDVSLCGCFVASTETPASGDRLGVTLHIDGRGGAIRVLASAEVVRCLPGGFAVQFLELLEVDSYEHLRNLVLYNAEDPNQAETEFDSHLGLKRIDPGQAPPVDRASALPSMLRLVTDLVAQLVRAQDCGS